MLFHLWFKTENDIDCNNLYFIILLLLNTIHATESPKPAETTPFHDYW